MTGRRRVRVLHVITSLTVGGAERLVLSAARGLAPDRFEHAICCIAEPGALAPEATAAGVPLFTVGAFPGVTHPLTFVRLVRLMRRFSPTIVHTHLQSANLYGRFAAKLAAVPIIIATEHNVYAQKPRRYIVAERLLARWTAVLIAVSASVQQFLARQLAVPASRIRVVYNGVAAGHPCARGIDALRERLAADVPIVAVVASLTPKKGHEVLLRAYAALRRRGLACRLVLAGDGPQRPRLEALARELEIDRSVTFLGIVRSADVWAIADVVALPSLTEGLPLALLEAMLAGKAVVATAVGGVPEVVASNVNGVLVPPGDADALADGIAQLLASPALRVRLGDEARRTVERSYTEDAYLRSLETIYLDALGQTP